jgi:hypothetical protein
LAITSPTSGGRLVSIVRSRAWTTELLLLLKHTKSGELINSLVRLVGKETISDNLESQVSLPNILLIGGKSFLVKDEERDKKFIIIIIIIIVGIIMMKRST